MASIKPKAPTQETDDSTEAAAPMTPEQRYQMIADAAYFRAQSQDFRGNPAQDWMDAEADINRQLLQAGQTPLTPKQILQQKLEAQLQELDALFDNLKLQASLGKAELRSELEKQLDSLAHKRQTAQTKLNDLSRRTENAWEDLKEGSEKAWDEVRQTISHIADRFR